MSIVAFVDTSKHRPDLAIELAMAMAEFSIEENEPLFLLTDAVTALEIGLSLIGSRESRTVEGGEYRVSPIRLLPFIPLAEPKEEEALQPEREPEFRANAGDDSPVREVYAGGDISELFQLGLFVRPGEEEEQWQSDDKPATALLRVLENERPRHIVGLGGGSVYWETVNDAIQRSVAYYRPQIFLVEGFGPESFVDPDEGRYEPLFVRPADRYQARRQEDESSRERGEMEETRLAAAHDGAMVAGFFQLLITKVKGDGKPD